MRTRALRRLGVLLATPALLAFACRGPERRGAEAGAGAASGGGPAVASEPEPTFERFESGGVPAYALMRERGRGVVHLDPGPLLAGRVADTLVARAEPNRGAPVLARLVLDTTVVFTFEALPGVLARPGALEFGYAEIGLPILERGTGGWERVYLGEGPDGQPVSG
ncbi:MAG: hypothetical protein EXR95_06020 [Gemmatimonadetes bacterium]|nr:hypothetical protein [Gemmatimonadota bacterium]